MKDLPQSLQYCVPLISPDLRREEMMYQIADSLEMISKINDDMTNRINRRLTDDVLTRLGSIEKRLEAAQIKIKQLIGTNRATVVLSAAKYPVSDETDAKTFVKVFPSVLPHVKTGHDIPTGTDSPIAGRPKFFNSEHSIKEKQLFYNVNVRNEPKTWKSDDGLGDPPSDISCVSSLLVFNTSQNPYRKNAALYGLNDKRPRTRPVQPSDPESRGLLAEPPATFFQHNWGGGEAALLHDSIGYIPAHEKVPELNVPEWLPDLPGVARLSYTNNDFPSIAPSVASLLVDLPDIPLQAPSPLRNNDNQAAAIKSAVQPPLPPPPPPIPDSSLLATAQKQNPISVTSGIPLPPPLPPVITASIQQNVNKTPSNNDHSRANLMDAIRQAGGTDKFHFRSVEERKREKKRKLEKEREQGVLGGSDKQADKKSNANEGDLMSELSKALMLRRKGISGRTQENSSDSSVAADRKHSSKIDGAFVKISEMIPPPPVGNNAKAAVDHSSDWED